MKRTFAFLALLAFAAAAAADGLADLRGALARYPALAPLRAALEVKTLDRHGDGDGAEEKAGQASVLLEDGPRGLQVSYAKELLARMEAEARERGRDPKAKTPALWALGRMDATEFSPLVSATAHLARRLDDAVFKGEKADTWQGRPARQLTFSIPDGHLTASERKYVKHFEGALEVWIAADGTPLASSEHTSVSGRAFVVISFEARQDEDCSYAVTGDRLVTARRESRSVSSGAGEKGEQRVVTTLQPLT
jgi:hypothetical protein